MKQVLQPASEVWLQGDLLPKIDTGFSTSKPPLFDVLNYIYWKDRMQFFLERKGLQSLIFTANMFKIPKPKVEVYTKEQIKEIERNSRAMNALYCSSSLDDHNRISQYETS